MPEKFTRIVEKLLPYTPNTDQIAALEKIEQFLHSSSRSVFILTGYAGTGKTSLMAALVKALKTFNINTVLLAPTGRAAKVLSRYAHKTAFTIHRKIYKPKSPNNLFAGFVLAPNRLKNTVFIVDEASMISNEQAENNFFGSGRLLDDLLEYVYSGKNCKLIIVGDTAQLPPVGLDISPALDPYYYDSMGFDIMRSHLSQVVRQTEDSGILYNATLLRNMIDNPQNTTTIPKFRTRGMPDFMPITGMEITEKLEQAYNTVGVENTLVITRSNKMANRYNAGIRSKILYREDMISVDDMVMVVKNNYFWTNPRTGFIANGDIGRISAIYSYHDLYDLHFARVSIDLQDYGTAVDALVMLDTLNMDTPSMPYDDYKSLFNKIIEDYSNIPSSYQRILKVKKNKFFNALQIKFAYAVTCHKAQGGQWHTVFIDQTYFNPQNTDHQYLRWLYTAITRATHQVYLVNFHDSFFED